MAARTNLPVLPASEIRHSSKWNRFLSAAARDLRSTRPLATSQDFGWFIERTMYGDKPYMLPLSWFVTKGCSMDHAGSCTMCNFGAGHTYSDSELIWQVEQLLARMGPIPMIYITPLGSMFDDVEVPAAAREQILRRIAATGCRVYGTESRPESITDEKMATFREIFGPDVELQIGLGLESSDPFVRRNCTNKGLSETDYLRAIRTMQRYDIKSMVHILLKPAFLTEREAIEDAVNSCNWAWEHGADRVIFLMTNLKPYTLVNWLAGKGRYRVPYLWSGVEVLSRIGAGPGRPITLSGVYAGTPITQRAHNCDRCSDYYLERIQQFSMTLNPSILVELREYDCSCRDEWTQVLQEKSTPLEERLFGEYEYVARELFGDGWWETNSELIAADLSYIA